MIENPRRVVLIGAGASYGCTNIYPKQPPLGNKLYNELKKYYPKTWGDLNGNQEDVFQKDFEEGMDSLFTEGVSIGPFMQDMCRFFLEFRLTNKKNLYSELLDIFDKTIKDTLFASLNYDVIFELSAMTMGYSIEYFTYPPKDTKHLSLFKPHGSALFLPDTGTKFAKNGTHYNKGLKINVGGIKPCSINDMRSWMEETSMIPIASFYAKGKEAVVGQNILDERRIAMQSLMNNCKDLITIGVAPNTEDSHIWEPITNSKANFYFIGDKKQYDKYSSTRKSKNNNYIGDTFSNGLPGLIQIINT